MCVPFGVVGDLYVLGTVAFVSPHNLNDAFWQHHGVLEDHAFLTLSTLSSSTVSNHLLMVPTFSSLLLQTTLKTNSLSVVKPLKSGIHSYWNRIATD